MLGITESTHPYLRHNGIPLTIVSQNVTKLSRNILDKTRQISPYNLLDLQRHIDSYTPYNTIKPSCEISQIPYNVHKRHKTTYNSRGIHTRRHKRHIMPISDIRDIKTSGDLAIYDI